MTRIALRLEYFGKSFCGSQYQSGVRTVQSELESALGMVRRKPTRACFSGRTDSGVHARGQIAHVDWDESDLDFERLCWGLNGILKEDLSVRDAQPVPGSFHARFSALERTYVYRILNRPQRSALLKGTHYFVPHRLLLKAMDEAAHMLIGEHDFAGFKSSNSDTVSTICRVSRAELLNLGEGVLEFWVTANHFVYNMVRIIVGTLVEIGLGKRTPESLNHALSGKTRDLSGGTAPSWGLCLESVTYPEKYNLFTSLTAACIPEEI